MEEILKELKLLSDGEIRAKCKELEIKGFYSFQGRKMAEIKPNPDSFWMGSYKFRI